MVPSDDIGRMATAVPGHGPEKGSRMDLRITHDSVDDIPEAYRELYTEREGKWHLTGIAGVKTQGDIDRLTSALQKERDEHKTTKDKLHQWDGLELDDVRQKLDRFQELEVAAKGKSEELDTKLEELTEARVRSRLAPVERENTTLKTKLEKLEKEYQEMVAKEVQRQISDAVRDACTKGTKVLDSAVDDVLMLAGAVFEVTEDGVVLTKENPFGVTPGLAPDIWLQEMQPKRPHWWPTNQGGGSKGSGNIGGIGKNPWTHDNWNMTEQGKFVQEHGMEKAKQAAAAAGTTVGGGRPAVKK